MTDGGVLPVDIFPMRSHEAVCVETVRDRIAAIIHFVMGRSFGKCLWVHSVKISRGRKAETTKFGTSTISDILRSTATLHIA